MTNLEANSTGLEEILAMVNALPEAGSGGGGSDENGGILMSAGTIVMSETSSTMVIPHALGKHPNFFAVFVPYSFGGWNGSTKSMMLYIMQTPADNAISVKSSIFGGTTTTYSHAQSGTSIYRIQRGGVIDGTEANATSVVVSHGDNEMTLYAPTTTGYPTFYASRTYKWFAVYNPNMNYMPG